MKRTINGIEYDFHSGADLFGADLSGADLSGANLSRANLFEAKIDRCAFGKVYGLPIIIDPAIEPSDSEGESRR